MHNTQLQKRGKNEGIETLYGAIWGRKDVFILLQHSRRYEYKAAVTH